MHPKIELRPAGEDDLPRIDTWAQSIEADRFMSRHRPDPACAVLWKIIVADGADIGTAWLEQRAESPEAIFLGIFIGDPRWLSRGVGRAAIMKLLDEARARVGTVSVRLNVRANNARAIACYTSCGFVLTSSSVKTGQDGIAIPIITMQLAEDGNCA
jgi:RimJ/RimL family protein N-acetyltransferase